MTDLVVADAEPVEPVVEPALLATLDQLKAQLDIKRNVHDDELRLYLGAASNVVRGLVVIDMAAIPPEATLATLVIAEHLWETQRGSGGRLGQPDDDRLMGIRGFAIPHRAAQLLQGLTKTSSGPAFSFPPAEPYPAF